MMNMAIDRQSRSFSNNKRRVKSLAHYTQNCKKLSYLPYTLQLFSQLQRLFLYEQRFSHQLFEKNLYDLWFLCLIFCYDVFNE